METLREDIARKCYTNLEFFIMFWHMHLRTCDLRRKLVYHLCRLRKTKSLEKEETPGDCERWNSNVVDMIKREHKIKYLSIWATRTSFRAYNLTN